MVVVEESLEQRVEVIVADYVLDLGRRFADLYGDDGPALHGQNCRMTWAGFASAWEASATNR